MMTSVSGIFQLDLRPGIAASMPSLQILRLATSSAPMFPGHPRANSASALIVSAHDIALFLRWHVQFDAPRLTQLVLKGVDVYEPPGSVERVELEALAEEILVLERHVPPLPQVVRRFAGSFNFRSTSWIFDELEE
ncbi:hypothetical protein EXIGLDRAFT_723342 [Exidia glandulosa HHB12029]|uniref:Uncharacterized protein n=1 Tax=Exidia glandulosa HHB12029 TaxID=1314781 RepID=A0A165EVW7_EXIGL|nr:hypothetical protein EXIGLDRAFT_723342 [Exidia glandulosa HHB12029]